MPLSLRLLSKVKHPAPRLDLQKNGNMRSQRSLSRLIPHLTLSGPGFFKSASARTLATHSSWHGPTACWHLPVSWPSLSPKSSLVCRSRSLRHSRPEPPSNTKLRRSSLTDQLQSNRLFQHTNQMNNSHETTLFPPAPLQAVPKVLSSSLRP